MKIATFAQTFNFGNGHDGRVILGTIRANLSWFRRKLAMIHELIGRYPAPDDREQLGRFLRHAFPLGVESFGALATGCDLDRGGQRSGEPSVERALLALID
jgi:hypothetical protein